MRKILPRILIAAGGIVLGAFGIWLLQLSGLLLPPTPFQKRIAILDLGIDHVVVFARVNEKIISMERCAKVINTSSFKAENVWIRYQGYSAKMGKWLKKRTILEICGKNKERGPYDTPSDISLPPRSTLKGRLASGIDILIRFNKKHEPYHVLRIDWQNPNGSTGCLFRRFTPPLMKWLGLRVSRRKALFDMYIT